MTAPWASRGDPSLDVLRKVQGSLTVAMIMAPRDILETCRRTETAADVKARNQDLFSFYPVVDDNDRIIGLYDAQRWFERDAPCEPINDDFEPFSEDLVIGADASIFDFVQKADERPTRLVVSGHQVAGLVSLSDLQQLPVRAALFALLTGLEMAMAERISRNWQDSADGWLQLLSVKRREEVEKAAAEAKRKDSFVGEIVLTQLSDKATIICKAKLLERSRRQAEKDFSLIRDLRDNLAHANYYAESAEDARQVCAVVRTVLDLKTELLDALEPDVSNSILTEAP